MTKFKVTILLVILASLSGAETNNTPYSRDSAGHEKFDVEDISEELSKNFLSEHEHRKTSTENGNDEDGTESTWSTRSDQDEEKFVKNEHRVQIEDCEYTSTSWSDCDPELMLRKKTLTREKYQPECAASKEISETCSFDDLPRGTQALLEREEESQKQLENYRRVLLGVSAKLGLLESGANHLTKRQQQANNMRSENNLKFKSVFYIIRRQKVEINRLREELETRSQGSSRIDPEACQQQFQTTKTDFENMKTKMAELVNRMTDDDTKNQDLLSCEENSRQLEKRIETCYSEEAEQVDSLTSKRKGSKYTNISKTSEINEEYSMYSSGTTKTLLLMKKMRDQMESFNFKEIELFDLIIKLMSEEQEKSISIHQLKVSRQEEKILALTASNVEKEKKLKELYDVISYLKGVRDSSQAALKSVSDKLGLAETTMRRVLLQYDQVKANYTRNEKYQLCSQKLSTAEKRYERSRIIVSELSQYTTSLKDNSVRQLVARVVQLKKTVKQSQESADSKEYTIRKQKDELDKVGEEVRYLMSEITSSHQKYLGLKKTVNTTIENEKFDFAKIKSGLDEVRGEVGQVFKEFGGTLGYKEDFMHCTNKLQNKNKAMQKYLSSVTDFKVQLGTFNKQHLNQLLKKFKASKSMEELQYVKLDEQESTISQQNNTIIKISNKLRSFVSHFKSMNVKYFGMKEVLKENEGHEVDVLKKVERDIEYVKSAINGIFESYQKKLSEDRQKYVRIKTQLGHFRDKMTLDMECQEKLKVCLDQREEYRVHLREEQMQLYKCNARYYRTQKVLKDVSQFYSYLVERLVRFHDGIHNLQQVGVNLRENLVKVHAAMGHCTGNLQALRNECQGLVSWYQTLPNIEVLKRKLSSCEHDTMASPFMMEQINSQKEKFSNLVKQEEMCESRLRESMTEMIALTRHFHTLQNNGVPEDSSMIEYIEGDAQKLQNINQVLYDHVIEVQNKTIGEGRAPILVNNWNMTSLQTTQQALNYLFSNENTSIDSAAYDDVTQMSNMHNKSLGSLSVAHMGYIKQIKQGMAQLNQSKNSLIQKLKRCAEFRTRPVPAHFKDSTSPPSSTSSWKEKSVESNGFPMADRVMAEKREDIKNNEEIINVEPRNISPKFNKDVSHPHKKDEEIVANQTTSQEPNQTKNVNVGSKMAPPQPTTDKMGPSQLTTEKPADHEPTFLTTIMPSGINIEKIKGLLSQPSLEPPHLKPLQATDSKSAGLDVIREKMKEIKQRLEKERAVQEL